MKSRVTILDVAAQAGVSISSVSAALNGRPGVSEDTRGRIVDVAQQLGWVPSLRGRSLSGRKAYAVGLMLERSSEVIESDPFFAGFIAGVESVLERQGLRSRPPGRVQPRGPPSSATGSWLSTTASTGCSSPTCRRTTRGCDW